MRNEEARTESSNPALNQRMNQISNEFDLDSKLNYIGDEHELYAKKFEVFTALMALHNTSPLLSRKVKDPLSLTLGGGDDNGIDSVIIIINNEYIIDDIEQLEEVLEGMYEKDDSIDSVDFIYVQSKTSERFDSHDIHTTLNGIDRFMNKEKLPTVNKDLSDRFEIKNYLYERADVIKEFNAYIYYITQSKVGVDKNEEAAFSDRIDSIKESSELLGCNYNDFNFIPIGMKSLLDIYNKYRQYKQKVSFSVFERIPFEPVDDVGKSFMTYIYLSEFLKILSLGVKSKNGRYRLEESIFEENVRSFQGDGNEVNSKILNSLLEGEAAKFFVLNNGITMIADRVKSDVTNKDFTVHHPQIINGCQTSNMLYRYYIYLWKECKTKSELEDKLKEVRIPLKIIEVKSTDLTSKIVESANSQTGINSDQLYALSSIAREIQNFFNEAKSGEPPKQDLYYERRHNEYAFNNEVVKARVITQDDMLSIYASTFLKLAHKSSRYSSDLKNKENIQKVFNENNLPINFYLAAYAHLKYVDESNKNPRFEKNLRWHTLMVHYILYGQKYNINYINSKEFNQEEEIKKIKNSVSGNSLLIANNVVLKFIDTDPKYSNLTIRNLNKKVEFTHDLNVHVHKLSKNKKMKDKDFVNSLLLYKSQKFNPSSKSRYTLYSGSEVSAILLDRLGKEPSDLFDQVFEKIEGRENIVFRWQNSAFEKNRYEFSICVANDSNPDGLRVGSVLYRKGSRDLRFRLGLQDRQFQNNKNFYDEFLQNPIVGFACDLSPENIGTNKHEHALIYFSENSSEALLRVIGKIIFKTYKFKNNEI